MTLTYGELFAGYDGLGMGVRSVLGGETSWFCEFDKAPSKILAHHYPNVPNYGDVTKVDWASVPKVDVITGGSPCQDLSHAGKRKGMTDGTRSNLWVQMREAIAVIRPRLVVWENVRGALSAPAASALEPCPGCMGGADDRGPSLRALGRVVGDLAELGYDARWYGLRAADVGGAHGRFRVFLFATPADADDAGWGEYGRPVTVRPEQPAAEHAGPDAAGLTLLPTPAVNDMGAAYTPETWDAWTAKQKANHGNGNGHGKSLAIEAQRLLSTPQARDYKGLPADGFNTACLVRDVHLLPNPTTTQRGTDANLDTREGARANLHNEVAKLLPTPEASRAGGTMEAHLERKRLADGSTRTAVTNLDVLAAGTQDWREYAAAIARAEAATGRTAPPPTEQDWEKWRESLERRKASRMPAGRRGSIRRWTQPPSPRLSPAFVEWLMMLPAGHVTDPAIDLTRNEQLKALGNGVVPPQAAAATRAFVADTLAERGAA